MKTLLIILTFLTCQLSALTNFADIYPPIWQTLEETGTFEGDRRGEFAGDFVAILSDGSAWKIHPDCREDFQRWYYGDRIRATVRTDHYWFKREHAFALYNYDRDEYVKAMLIFHKAIPTKIVSIDSYAKSSRSKFTPKVIWYTDASGQLQSRTEYVFDGYEPSDFRKVIELNDGSTWVIKNKLREFQVGMNVYVGAQGVPGEFYDFVLIGGDQREAVWTMARPQK